MPDNNLRYHLMKCDLISKTGDRLFDMIITYIRSNGDYDKEGADCSKVLPMLQASGWTVEQLTEVIQALEAEEYILGRKRGFLQHHYRFNYRLK